MEILPKHLAKIPLEEPELGRCELPAAHSDYSPKTPEALRSNPIRCSETVI